MTSDSADGSASLTTTKGRHVGARDRFKLGEFLPALALLLVGMTALVIATLSPSGDSGQYAVIAPPWSRLVDTIALIQKADGRIVDMGGPPNVIIAHSTNPDFVQALYGAGAWLVIDPMMLRGCAGLVQETL